MVEKVAVGPMACLHAACMHDTLPIYVLQVHSKTLSTFLFNFLAPLIFLCKPTWGDQEEFADETLRLAPYWGTCAVASLILWWFPESYEVSCHKHANASKEVPPFLQLKTIS